MYIATWTSTKSLIMSEIRQNLKKKAEPGQPTPSRREANRTWREDILGILSEDQKKQRKAKLQEKNTKKRRPKFEEEE